MSTRKLKDEYFDLYEIKQDDLEVQICPYRGNIIKSLKYKGNELILIKHDNYPSNDRPTCGCPVLFPYSGNNENNKLIFNNIEYETGIHGVVHTNNWQIVEQGTDFIEFFTKSNEITKKVYPFDFTLFSNLKIKENKLIYKLSVVNDSKVSMPCDFGLHPFFKISNLDNLTFEGLNKDETKLGDSIIDRHQVLESGFMCKKINKLIMKDKKSNMQYIFENDENYQNILIWSGNPEKFVVIEPLTAFPNAINMHDNRFNLAPKEKVQVQFSISIKEVNNE